ncbi:sugar phosphate isomerase/epimerase family protein [Reichenbachiella ulvae]|uniref:Sugar phosphate isomerase/epimerase n=1 Tax=Reichenbachiella ulvae TaxID=2980104 RepID=A0ABT3CP30_9BACT|nr:sugar phosphate isomerase/epimerase [Reichenbachiella ulvae]MCV9385279.1 sugar phosphate isomerase/epimerase [Reichenbachiella ulvae]
MILKVLTFKNFIVLIGISLATYGCKTRLSWDQPKSKHWQLNSYNFGGLELLSAADQVDLLRSSGYDGIVLRVARPENFEMLPEFLAYADTFDDFAVDAAFVRYNFNDSIESRERWRVVVDQIADKQIQLWVIFGKKEVGFGDDFVEAKLREILEYAKPRGVEVILYPHSDCYFESAEEALPLVERINDSQLNLAFHLYHEVRAHNGARIDQVLDRIQHRLGAVTLAGTDSVADYRSSLTRDSTTIKALGQGTFDVDLLLIEIQKIGYSGNIALMNFGIKQAPAVYLKNNSKIMKEYMD